VQGIEEMVVSDPERFNLLFFMWLLASPVVMLYVTLWSPGKKKIIIGVLLSLTLTFVLSNLSVMRKWDLRMENAVTVQEKENASADGANKVFNLIFLSPIEAVLFTVFWSGVGCMVYRVRNQP